MKTASSAVTVMTVEEIHAATVKLTTLGEQMTFILPLTDAERRDHTAARLGLKKLRMMESRVVAARQNRELLPPAFDLRKFEQDAALTVALGECQAAIDKIWTGINDTLMAVGQRAVVQAATAYGYIKVASTSAEKLKQTVEKITPRRSRALRKEAPPAPVPIPVKPTEGLPPTPADVPAVPTDKAA